MKPSIGPMPIASVEPTDILAALRKLERRGNLESARRCLHFVGQVMRYALATARLSADPSRDLKGAPVPPRVKHHAAITDPKTRGHLVLGVQGLAPYMWHVDLAAFLSDRGDLTARLEGEYDQKITQRLILQPRIELKLAAQDIPERNTGAGLVKIEPGLRLRYEVVREFAPYIGVEYEALLGETADIARARGEDPSGWKVLVGLRAWF